LTMLGDPRTVLTPHSGILKTLVLGKMALTADSAGRDRAGVAQSSRALLSGLRRLVSAGSREQSPPPASTPIMQEPLLSDRIKDRKDIYHFDRHLRSAYAVLDRSSIDPKDKELIRSFATHLEAQNVGKGRLTKYIFTLKVVAEHLDCRFEDANRKDIERLMVWLNGLGYSPHTVTDYTFFVKRFYKFVRNGNVDRDTPYPEEVRWLRKNIKLNEMTKPQFLSAEEVKAMIQVSKSARDRAMLAVGFEAGLRASELLKMDIADFAFDDRGVRARVSGKTGERIIRLVSSSPMLAHYLETHPLKDHPEAPLWLTEARNRQNERMSWVSWNKILKNLAVKAGIKKRVHNHLLRHGSATSNARFLTDAEMRVMYGWTMDSKMPSVYIHLNGGDLDDKLIGIHTGQPVAPVKPEFSLVNCVKCNEKNTPGVRYCGRCGTPLNQAELSKGSIESEAMKTELQEMKKLVHDLLSRRTDEVNEGRQRNNLASTTNSGILS